MEVAAKIGDRIQRLRRKARWTQAVLSKVTSIPQGQISSYESGKDSPKIENLIKLADAFNCSVAAIDPRLAKAGVSGDELLQNAMDDIDQAILAELEGLPAQAKLQLLARIGELRANCGLAASDEGGKANPRKL